MNREKEDKHPLNEYEISEIIFKTSNSVYRFAKSKKSQLNSFSIKIVEKLRVLQDKLYDQLYNEYNLTKSLNHPFILKLKNFHQDPSYLYFVYDYVTNGNLFSALKQNNTVNYEATRFYLAQLVTIIDYLHKNNIMYRDLNPYNLLLDANGYLKLTNFKYAKIMKNNDVTFTVCGLPEFLAPEVILNKGYSKAVDFWMLGVLAFTLQVGETPFYNPDPILIYQNIIKVKYHFPKGKIDKEMANFIGKLLNDNPKERFGADDGIEELYRHKLFRGFNWSDQINQTSIPPFLNAEGPMRISDPFVIDKSNPLDPDQDPFLNW